MRRSLLAAALTLPALLIAPAASAQEGPDPADYFTQAQLDVSDAYRGRLYVLTLSALGLALIIAGVVGLGRGSRGLARWSARFRRRSTRALALIVVVMVAPELAILPFTLGAHRHARAFGLATNDAAGALRDVAVTTGFRVAIFAVLALVLIALARRLPRAWGLLAAPVAGGLTALMVAVFPLVVEPAFNAFEPVDADTRARVEALAERADVAVGEVLVADASRRTSALNAYVSGLGATKRVVIYDTLLERLPPAQVDAVVAHELAHVAAGDVARGTLIAGVGVAAAVLLLWILLGRAGLRRWIGAAAPGDPAVIPFVAFYLAAAMVLSAPAANAISRDIEANADVAAIVYTDRPRAMIDLQVRLAIENLSDVRPPAFIRWAFFTHPTTMERIAIAEAAR